MSEPLRIGIAGLGTVGAEVFKQLSINNAYLSQRGGRPLEVTAVSARDRTKDRGVEIADRLWVDSPAAMAASDNVDVVIELIGGSEGVAKEFVEAALDRGKHVVTGNKALVAVHGTDLARRSSANGAAFYYESAVAGGIPIVKALREGLAANQVHRMYGILNGTCNYILTKMDATGQSFEDVLKEAQELGYAEADPSFDVGGIDAAHKICILSAIAFGTEVDFDGIFCEGISTITPLDLSFGREFGYRLKLLAITEKTDDGVLQRVHPAFIKVSAPLADVDDVYNAVVAEGDLVGRTVYEGRGAGAGPTTSAVLADLIDIAQGNLLPMFLKPADELASTKRADMGNRTGTFYLRLQVLDRAGVLAKIAQLLSIEEISIDSMVQRSRNPDSMVSVVLVTHETSEARMSRALSAIADLKEVVAPPCMIRIEEF